ncbi:MAG: MASE1 domain-containing protein [Cyclobacteriaceae bacterium]|nr:MASE1 domain-containing protein [Cyclobacteriaceae bacterium]
MSQLLVQTKLTLKYDLDLKIILFAVLYYIAARLGYFLSFQDTTALPAWPPSGIAFALILLMGRVAWPGITIGALIANVMAYWNTPDVPAQTVIAVSSCIAVGHTLEALIGNYLLRHWIRDDYPFRNARNAFRFLFVTLVMAVAGASIGTSSLLLFGLLPEDRILQSSLSWWVGNVVGILLFTPFVLALVRGRRITFNLEKGIEIAVFLAGIAGLYMLLQLDYMAETIGRALPFLILPFLLWLAFRFDLVVAITGVLLASLFAIYLTVNREGPFVLEESSNSMLLLQIFIGVTSISTIILSATVRERLTVQRELETFNSNLETMVLDRTKELNEEIRTRRLAEEKLRKTNEELSKRNAELDNFVYSVSHDLRAPIASVLGLINLVRKDKDSKMREMYLDMIYRSAQQQDHFIKEILDQSRNSRLDVNREEVYFEPLIAETFDQLKLAFVNENVQKHVSVKQEGPFYSDRWRLKVILSNIISNSIRYRNGKDPEIRVDVRADKDRVQVSIKDNGRGIAREHLPQVCKMFYRATDDGHGSGLGLYIAKEAVEKLNGSLNISSREGEGTTVNLEIPMMRA